MSGKQSIVVIGSGGGGVPLIQFLQKQINSTTHQIVVVEKRDYYAHWPSLIRAAVTSDGLTEETGLIPVDCAFGPSVLLVRSTVRRITSTEVITESRERVSYTQLVLATGSLWNGALALPDSRVKAIEHLRAFRKRLEGAESVVIIGGGAVGIEYAGELAHYFSNKKVTLVHGQAALMNDAYPAKFRKSLLDSLTKVGVQIILEDKISTTIVPEDGHVTTEKGRRVKADFLINATGGRPNTSIVSTLDPSVVTPSGTVLVTPELNVRLASGARNVWAIGDIIEWSEQKMIGKALRAHAPLVASNITAVLNNKRPKPYLGGPEIILITLGPRGGRGLIPFFGGIIVGDWPTTKVKSADLYIQQIRKNLGYVDKTSGCGNSAALWGVVLFAIPVAYALYTKFSARVWC